MKNELMAPASTPEENKGLSQEADASRDIGELQSAMVVAQRFPRDEDAAYQEMMRAATRPTFQETAVYRFPRAGQDIVGPSVELTNYFKYVWGNFWSGFYIVGETEDSMHIRGWAFDLQKNIRRVEDVRFKLLIKRKGKWIKPDERDRRELVNRNGAIAERNSIKRLLPGHVIDDVIKTVTANQQKGISNAIEQSRKNIIGAFGLLQIPAEEIEQVIGCPLKEATAEQITQLRQIYQSVKDGVTRWGEYKKQAEPSAKEPPPADLSSLIASGDIEAKAGPSAEPEKNPRAPVAAPKPAAVAGDIRAGSSEDGREKPAQGHSEFTERIDSAKFIKDVERIMAEAAIHESMTDSHHALLVDYGRERIEQIRASRTKMSPEHLKCIGVADQENARMRDDRLLSPDGMTPSERAMTESERGEE